MKEKYGKKSTKKIRGISASRVQAAQAGIVARGKARIKNIKSFLKSALGLDRGATKKRKARKIVNAAASRARKRPDLAIERNYLAAENTLMGWIRTALSMIGFGFTIYKFLESALSKESASQTLTQNSPRTVGLTLICIGVFSLVIACLQHWRYVKRLSSDQPHRPFDLALVVAAMVGSLGLAMIVSIILRAGPLG
jgi:putative membrane protein